MLNDEKKKLYFIYSQNGEKTNIGELEKTENIEEIQELHTEKKESVLYIIYSLTLKSGFKDSSLIIPLIDIKGDSYNAKIDNIRSQPENFIFVINFNSKSSKNNLAQLTIPINEQFSIFSKLDNYTKNLSAKYKTYLCFNVFDVISGKIKDAINENQKCPPEELINIFIKSYFIQKENPDDKIMEEFFSLLNPKLIGSIKVGLTANSKNEFFEKAKLTDMNLNEFKNVLDIQKKLQTLTGNNEKLEEKIDVVLAIFYYFYGVQFYIKFVTCLNPRFDNVSKILKQNRIIFGNFSGEMSHDLIFKTEDINQIDSLLKYIPDMTSLIKLLENEKIFMKLSILCQSKKKVVNLAKYWPLKADDDIESIRNNSLSIIQKFKREGVIHIYYSEDFFNQYFNLFNKKDLHKLQLIKDIYKSYNSIIRDSYTLDDDLNKIYHETGLYLINNGKLFNQDIIDFINNDPEISYMKKDEIENFSKGFDLAKADPKFLNDFLSGKDDEDDDENDKKNLRKLLGNNYSKFLGKIFDKLKTLKDYLCLVNWKMDNNTTRKEVINVCFKEFKEVWIREKTNNLYGLDNFIAVLFCRGAQKIKNFIDELKDLSDSRISLNALLKVYSNLIKEYYMPKQCREYIRDFILKKSDNGPLGLWFKTTCEDSSDRLSFLKSNLKKDFAVQIEDFVHYPLKVENEDRIILFTNLYKDGFLQFPEIQKMEYYKISIHSVDNLEELKYSEAAIMITNIISLNTLFISFVLQRNQRERNIILDKILSEFSKKCFSLKPKLESLKSILKYLKKFHSTTEGKKIDDLKKDINTFENNKIKDFATFEEIYKKYENLAKVAELGGELINSMFFMEIYSKIGKFGKNQEKQHFDYSLEKFNQLFDDIDSLDEEIISILKDCIDKNKNKLKDELLFLTIYYEQIQPEDNSGKEKIKKIIEQFGIQDDNNKLNIEDIENEAKKEKEIKERKRDDADNFNLSKNQLLDDIHKVTNECLNKLKTKSDIDVSREKFIDYFNKIFELNYSTLTEKELMEEVISVMKKIYLLGVNELNVGENSNGDLCVINEFYAIFEAYTKEKLESKEFLKILQIFKEYRENSENDEDHLSKIVNKIQKLLDLISEDIEFQKMFGLFIYICIQEHNRHISIEFDQKLIEKIFNRNLLMEKAIPLLHIIFNEDFVGRLKKKERNNDIKSFKNTLLKKINDKCSYKNFEQRLLHYFESVIMRFFEDSYDEDNKFYRNVQNYLQDSLIYLENEYNNNNNNNIDNPQISKLYCLSFVKVFLKKFINDLMDGNQKIEEERKNIITIIAGSDNNKFRTCLKLYLLKLIYDYKESYIDYLQLNINSKYEIDFLDNENIKEIKGDKDTEIVQNDMHGYEYYFLPISDKSNKKDKNVYHISFISIFKGIKNIIIKNEMSSDEEEDLLNEIKTKDSDIFYCVLVNLCFSHYYNEKFFESEKFSNLQKWIKEKIFENSLFIEEKENSKKELFEIFLNKDKYKEKILTNNLIALNYNQLLSVLIAFRFVIYTLSLKKDNNYENKIFHKLLYNPDNDVKKICNYFFIENVQFDNAKFITKKIIRFVILSHLYFSYLLGKITLEKVNDLINPEKDSIINTLAEELSSIQKIIKLKGVRNIIIYMNYAFIKLKENIKKDNDIIKLEKGFDKVIDDSFDNYADNYEEYLQLVNLLEESLMNENEVKNNEKTSNEYISFLYENSELINEENIEQKYPFITYLTLTNFCSLDDFGKQFYYFTNSQEKYPLINYLLSKDEKNELNIIKYLPVINKCYNNIFNCLFLKITSDDTKNPISDYEIDVESYSELNKNINEINNYLDEKINEITSQTQIKDIINVKNNSIFKLYNKIINIYNSFLSKIKIFENNKNWIDPVIIQNCSNKDYFNFPENKTKMLEKLKDILCAYSEKHKFKGEKINVYNGGKIEYEFEDIENLLQKEFLLGKKLFKENQTLFIFSNEVYSNENNNLFKELKIRYPQTELNELNDHSVVDLINEYIESLNEEKDIKNAYANMQYMIIYLTDKNNEKYNAEKTSLYFIASILEKNNYEIEENLKIMLNNLIDGLFIKHILFLHEKLEIKYFNELNDEIKNNLRININGENTDNISEYFEQENLLITQEVMEDAIKKYILRYCLGNYSNDNGAFNFDDIENIFKKDDLFSNRITENERFKEEVSKLIELNQKKEHNYVLQYLFENIFSDDKED